VLVPKLVTTLKDYSRTRFVTDLAAGVMAAITRVGLVLARASALPPLSDAATFLR
jgi:hypothetical protein